MFVTEVDIAFTITFLFNSFVVTPGTTKKEYRDRTQRLLRYRYPIGAHSCILISFFKELFCLLKKPAFLFIEYYLQSTCQDTFW